MGRFRVGMFRNILPQACHMQNGKVFNPPKSIASMMFDSPRGATLQTFVDKFERSLADGLTISSPHNFLAYIVTLG